MHLHFTLKTMYFSLFTSINLLRRFRLQKEAERFLEECFNSDLLEEIEALCQTLQVSLFLITSVGVLYTCKANFY